MSFRLLEVHLQMVDSAKCESDYTRAGLLLNTQGQMCATDKIGKGVCYADRGGPLMCTGSLDPEISACVYLVGVSSFEMGNCGYSTAPVVYTEIR